LLERFESQSVYSSIFTDVSLFELARVLLQQIFLHVTCDVDVFVLREVVVDDGQPVGDQVVVDAGADVFVVVAVEHVFLLGEAHCLELAFADFGEEVQSLLVHGPAFGVDADRGGLLAVVEEELAVLALGDVAGHGLDLVFGVQGALAEEVFGAVLLVHDATQLQHLEFLQRGAAGLLVLLGQDVQVLNLDLGFDRSLVHE